MRLTGRSLADHEFVVATAQGQVPSQPLAALLTGRLAGLHVRGAITEDQRAALLARFWSSRGLTERGGGVQGHYVGAYHYGNPLDRYLKEVEASRADIAELLGAEDPVTLVVDAVGKAVKGLGASVRLASHEGRPAGRTRTVSWLTDGSNLLDPHEDASQLRHPDLDGFEVQRAYERGVTAANVYLNMPPGGGHIRIWNIDPDEDSKRRFGVEHTGYYYPEPSVAGIPHVDVAPASGDLLFLNGRLVHAVIGYQGGSGVGAERVSMNFVIGFIDPETVVYWA